MALTRRQRQVLDVIRDFIDQNGYSPSLEEIGAHLSLSSVATVHKHVSHLVQKGFVRRTWNQNRSIEVVEHGSSTGAVPLRLAGRIAAGRPVEAIAIEESIFVPAEMIRNPSDTYVLRVRGDSMIGDQIRDGDLVIVERRSTAHDGETVVALLGGNEATLKRFYRAGAEIRLEPANPEARPITVRADELQIQGVVVGLIRKY